MKKLILTFSIGLLILQLGAQPTVVDTRRFAFEPDLSYLPGIQSPKEYLGYELGEAFTVYAKVEAYFKQLAEASPRVIYHEYGETYEGRPLINLVISSEENIQKIDQLQNTHLSLQTASGSQAQDIINNQPVFMSFSYNIHGNEASSTEAAMQVAYRLAAATDQTILDVLKKEVIVLYICINPDGRDRYVYWYKTTKRIGRPAEEPRDMEHYEPWPGGRTNHYWFDVNRDWVWGVHPETRGLANEFQNWMPQAHVDCHEQGYNSNYFTGPGTTPRNKLLPESYEPWSKVFGDANIAEFDKHQINYFTRDAFDFFYPGYGSSYPSVMGGIGMLVEQGGHSAGGRIVETEDGYRLTLRQRIFDHYTTSLASIKAAAANRQALLQYSYDAWQPAKSKSTTKAYFFSGSDMYSGDLVNVLLRNGINVYQANAGFQVAQAKDYQTGNVIKKSLPAGTYIVPTDQPRHLLINSIMERNLAIEDSVMYDMATWSAPIAYNLEAYSTSGTYSVDKKQLTELISYTGKVTNTAPQYAYVVDWSQRKAPQALAMLWAKGYHVRSAFEPFGDGTRSYPAGSLVILKGRNLEKAATIDADMAEIARRAGVEIVGHNTGRMVTGMDLASTRNRPIDQPKVAMMVDEPFSSYTGGQIYFLFDWETGLPIERVRTSTLQQTSLPKGSFRFGGVDMKAYDVLILPEGGRNLTQVFGDKALAEIKAWVEEGGVLIASESAVGFFTKGNSGFTQVEMKKAPKDTSEALKRLAYADRENYFGWKRVPGTAMNGLIDTTHPLAFGVKKNLYTLKFDNDGLMPSPEMQTVGSYVNDPRQLMVA
ncbi:MAG: M14 family metallopeptidase, partial [Cyclobacteriaceae bacterium]|nr:M14 family metallopeptidase [Cyclobacteriaceae bacterium]